ncbi:MAG: beta-galactosidase [Armatimonadetes bacterium]|nr:beta-galactosidase [Armatimonadota bacterium]
MLSWRSLLALALLTPCLGATDLAVNGGFEAAGGWDLRCVDGAEGSATWITDARTGRQALRLTKTNSLGYLRLVSSEPLALVPNETYTFRGWYRSEDAPISALLLFRVAGREGTLAYNAIDRSAGWMSQSLILNAPPGRWEKRVVTHAVTQPTQAHLNVALWGNPCSVVLDDLEMTTARWYPSPAPGAYLPGVSEVEAKRILAERPALDGRIESRQGRSALLINGRPVAPVIFKSGRYDDQGDQAAFHADGIDLALVPIRLGGVKDTPGVWEGAGRYDFALAEASLDAALRRNPQAQIIIDFWVYPYRAWGEENPAECWINEAGERAYGWWGNVEGFATDLATAPNPERRHWWYPSYGSPIWQRDAADALAAVVRHLSSRPQWKAVVGCMVTGGHDGQFQVLAERDHCPANRAAFATWLQRQHGGLQELKRAWGEAPTAWTEIAIPRGEDRRRGMESLPAFLAPGPEIDYRRFEVEQSWRLRDLLARAVEDNAGKTLFSLSYGMPPGYDFGPWAKPSALDAAASMSYYPYRVPGYATGYRPPDSPRLHDKLFIQELDVRSWVADGSGEVYDRWIGKGDSPERWRAVMRKLIGISLAHGHGYWYYDMNQFFAAPEIHAQIAQLQRITERVVAIPDGGFRPDVVVVRSAHEEQWQGAYFSSSKHALFYQTMELESSGVPYDVHYLSDILARPELQRYKVFLFVGSPYLSAAERAGIARLKQGGRMLIFTYGAGYVTETGKSVAAQSELAGLKLATAELRERRTPLLVDHELTRGCRPLNALTEMQMTIFHTAGASSVAAREQPFWVEDPTAEPLARFVENGQVAMALKRHGDWTAVYLAAPNSLGGDLLHKLVSAAGAFTYGEPGPAVSYSDRFVSIHGLRSGSYTLRLPPGTRRVVDPDSGRAIAEGVETVTLPVVAQQTDWYLLER